MVPLEVSFKDQIEECDKVATRTDMFISQKLEIGLRSKGKVQDTNLESTENREKRISSVLTAMSFCGFRFKIKRGRRQRWLDGKAKKFW